MPDNVFSGPLSNPTLRTIFVWGVAVNVLGRLLDPFLTQLAQEANAAHPEAVLTPQEAADMVLRGWLDMDTATSEAAGSGVNAERFQHMVNNAGEPPGLAQLLEAFRREIIDDARLEHGIRESRVRDEWSDVVKALRFAPPPVGEVVAAWVQNHLTAEEAATKLVEAGVDPVNHQWLYETHGRPPGPQELLHLLNRGEVSEADVIQAIRESDIKDKYIPAILALRVYLPPVRTVTALHRAGSITDDQAAKLYAENGVRPEDSAAYIAEAHHTKVAAVKNLALGEVGTLYEERAIPRDEAHGFIMDLGYSASQADFILEVYDLRAWRTWYNQTIGKIRTLYVGRHIDAAQAQIDMDRAHVPAEQKSELLGLWTLQRDANRTLLTPAQILKGHKDGVLTTDQARARLLAHGYADADATYLIQIDG